MTDSISVNDRGLAYGDGLFETIAIINNHLINWELHWQRLCFGADRLSMALPAEQVLLDLIAQKRKQSKSEQGFSASEAVLKIIITRGSGGRGYLFPEVSKPVIIIMSHDWPERNDSDYTSGIRAVVCQTCLAEQPALAGIKHLNRLEQVLGRNEFAQTDFAEGIMLACSDNDSIKASRLIEGTSSNLFFVLKDSLLTPKVDTCGVRGTTRQAVLSYAEQLSIPVEQGHYPLSELKQASEVFFTNSIYGIVPVASISIDADTVWLYKERQISSQLAMAINTELHRPVDFN